MKPIYFPETEKIDDAATDGLLGVSNSLAYHLAAVERYLLSMERFYGDDGDNTGSVANSLTPWTVTAGAGGAYGTEVQLLGVNDVIAADFNITPVNFVVSKMLVKDPSDLSAIYVLQLWAGDTTFGAATLVGETATIGTADKQHDIVLVSTNEPVPVTDKLWVRSKCEGAGATLDMIIGIRAFEG